MIKYLDSIITFQEVPGEISLCFTITNCKYNCNGCNQPELKEDIGNKLFIHTIKDKLIPEVTCVCFLGDGNDEDYLLLLADYVHCIGLKAALYTGSDWTSHEIYNMFDYIKYGRYNEKCGPLTSSTTNQKMINTKTGEDLTYKFYTQ